MSGELRMGDGTVFLPNDRYPLDREVFRLYYTSRSDDQQTIDVYVEDNTGQVVKTSFTLDRLYLFSLALSWFSVFMESARVTGASLG